MERAPPQFTFLQNNWLVLDTPRHSRKRQTFEWPVQLTDMIFIQWQQIIGKKSLNIALHDCLQGIRFMRDLFDNSFKMFSTASISQFLARADRRDIAPQKGLH